MADLGDPTTIRAAGSEPCEIDELLSGYLDGRLDRGELDQVVAHLAWCLDCIRTFHELRDVRTALRTLPVLELPEHLVPVSHHGAALSAYLDGELPTAEHVLVFSHVVECRLCRDELHDLDAARTAVRSLPGLDPPGLLVMAPGLTRRHRVRWQVATLAASVAAAVVVGSGLIGAPPSAPPLDLDAFADRHAARASLEAGFTVLPAIGNVGVEP
jgi:anti-sigma factor RsiW